MDAGAVEAVRRGRRGVHVVYADGRSERVYEAVRLVVEAGVECVRLRHLNGELGPLVPARQLRALERSYEPIGGHEGSVGGDG